MKAREFLATRVMHPLVGTLLAVMAQGFLQPAMPRAAHGFPRGGRGTAAAKRAARKRRNVIRNRRAHRA